IVLILGFATILGVALAVGVRDVPAQVEGPKAQGKDAPGHGKRAQEFLAAFNRGDAKAVAGFFTPDGDYVDQVGRQTKGRAALEKMYEKVFAARKGAKLSLTVFSTRFIGTDVALEEGITEVTSPDGPPTAARFSAVLVKNGGGGHCAGVPGALARPD